jgi:hypothetical protein
MIHRYIADIVGYIADIVEFSHPIVLQRSLAAI